jgi:hypothetical protein
LLFQLNLAKTDLPFLAYNIASQSSSARSSPYPSAYAQQQLVRHSPPQVVSYNPSYSSSQQLQPYSTYSQSSPGNYTAVQSSSNVYQHVRQEQTVTRVQASHPMFGKEPVDLTITETKRWEDGWRVQ